MSYENDKYGGGVPKMCTHEIKVMWKPFPCKLQIKRLELAVNRQTRHHRNSGPWIGKHKIRVHL